MITASTLTMKAAKVLAEAGVASPRTDAELLLAHVLQADRSEVTHHLILGTEIDAADAATYETLVAQRASRVPLQHLTGVAYFRQLELAVGPGVFIPRPETEAVAQVAIDEAKNVASKTGTAVVVDLCTGSGAIALSIATEVPGAQVHAIELDATAHKWAKLNFGRNINANTDTDTDTDAGVGASVGAKLYKGDARTALPELNGKADVVVSNPPYVPGDAIPKDPEVAQHDPAVALYGLGADGLTVPRGITAAAARLLKPGGLYVMEHAEVQAAAARAMVDATGLFTKAATRDDLTQRSRMVIARRNVSPVQN